MTPKFGGITAPKGFRASGVSAGIRKKPGRRDCALIVSDTPATVAGMFTTNLMKSPPVYWNIKVCSGGKARAVFINSGNANAATGMRGHEDVATTVEALHKAASIPQDEICICSTGVIGVNLPMDRILAGVKQCAESLSKEGSPDAAEAIMTTDTVRKEFAAELNLSGGAIRFGAIAKGSGMVSPNMATMIAVITTDASIDHPTLKAALRVAVDQSFHRICIDNDLSTSDTVLVFANGESGVKIPGDSKDFAVFQDSLTAFCQEIAKALVKDGEGATKFVEISVRGTVNDIDAKTIARAIAQSQLCKTAFFGQDANWGRFACAAGYAGVQFKPEDLCIWVDGVQLMDSGGACAYEEADASAVMKQPSFTIRLQVGNGPGAAVFWTSDLSHDYVSINADYRT